MGSSDWGHDPPGLRPLPMCASRHLQSRILRWTTDEIWGIPNSWMVDLAMDQSMGFDTLPFHGKSKNNMDLGVPMTMETSK